MKWASIFAAPWLAACLVAAPPPSEPAPPAAAPAPSSAPSQAASSSATPSPPAAAPLAVEATFEPTRVSTVVRRSEVEVVPPEMETRSVSFAPGLVTFPCTVGGRASRCVELADGPWLVTDYEALDGCPDALYLASAPRASVEGERLDLTWTIRVSDRGVHGARIAVAPDAKLIAALEPRKRGASNSERCAVTWSGHRPKESKSNDAQPSLMESPYR